MKKTLLAFGSLLLLFIALLVYKFVTYPSKQITTDGKRLEFPMLEAAVVHLQQAVRIPTVSYDQPGRMDTAAFDSIRNFLANAYPLLNKTCERTLINSFSIIYKWKGKNSSSKPVLLYAHLDVVPVETVNRNEWKHDPWAGEIADGFIWGRGTLDDKGSAIAIAESAEKLLSDHHYARDGSDKLSNNLAAEPNA